MEANELQDSIVRVLNIVCLSEGAALFKKITRDGLVCGERDPDSLLISYKMYDPGMEYLRETAQNWLNETLSFIYALRRIVDASPQGVIEEKYLIHFRRLDFVFLKGLVRLLAAKSIEAEDIDDLSQWLANLGSPTEDSGDGDRSRQRRRQGTYRVASSAIRCTVHPRFASTGMRSSCPWKVQLPPV